MKRITQEQRILRHLKDYGSITSWEAFREYGITRLSAVIFNLRKEYKINSDNWVKSKNRYGEPVAFVQYKLEEK